MKTPTVNRKELKVNTESWHWKWYTWSLQVIYDFFDGNTTHPRDAEVQRTNLCAYVQTRTAAITILLMQGIALGGLLVSITWLPVHLFGIWAYLNVWRVVAIAVFAAISAFALANAILPDKNAPYYFKSLKGRMNVALVSMGGVVIARLLVWNTGPTEYFNSLAGTMLILGGLTAIISGIALQRQNKLALRQATQSVESLDEMPVVEQKAPQEKTIGFWRVVWLYAKAAKAKVCPMVEPVRPTTSTEEVSD